MPHGAGIPSSAQFRASGRTDARRPKGCGCSESCTQDALLGVVYSVSMILLLTAVGSIAFRESLKPAEVVGLILAVASLVLLMRFA